MCTAYEIGKLRGSVPGYLDPDAVAEILTIQETRLIRPTIPAPVILADGSLREMKWGFRRSFAAKTKGGKPTTRTIVNSREDKMRRKTWLGDGPSRVWRNRWKGVSLGLWETDFNRTATGWSKLAYPEFGGYFSGVRWLRLKTTEGR